VQYQNLVRAPAHQHFSALRQNSALAPARQSFSVHRQNLARALARQYIAAQCRIFNYHKHFTMRHAFLVCTPTHIHFYAHQFLVNSAAEIGAFS
jgi:hypothetical protein